MSFTVRYDVNPCLAELRFHVDESGQELPSACQHNDFIGRP